MDSRTLTFLLSLLISVPLSTLYILQMILIVRKSATFNSSFYRIFFFCGAVDLLFYWLNVFLYVLLNLPSMSLFASQFVPIEFEPSNSRWREEYRSILSALNSLMYFTPAIQDALNILISFNRFSAIVIPLHYKALFTPIATNLYLILATLSGLIPSFITIGAPGTVVHGMEPEVYMLFADTKVNFPNIRGNLLVASYLLVTNFISFVFYCITALQLRKAKIQNTNEARLLVLGFVIFICNIPSIAYQMFFFFYHGTDFGFYFLMLPLFNLIKALNSPLAMILTNQMMRKTIKDFLGWSPIIRSVAPTGTQQTRITDTTTNIN